MSTDVVARVCQGYAVDGLRALSDSSPARPFRYLYVSGMLAERDQTKSPLFAAEYCLMRVSPLSLVAPLIFHHVNDKSQGQAENMVLKVGEESKGAVDVGVAKPGIIIKPGVSLASIAAAVGQAISVLDTVRLEECAAAMLDQAVNGFEKETIQNSDLRRIGEKVLGE
ncbi:hypothetical protein IMZ48_41830 [Candidatus Bathyarchaeota archaeon]|nr:hypothetical protein [Candidatus Bathyarchaeota archaeon]